jgi:hypothetical protein
MISGLLSGFSFDPSSLVGAKRNCKQFSKEPAAFKITLIIPIGFPKLNALQAIQFEEKLGPIIFCESEPTVKDIV